MNRYAFVNRHPQDVVEIFAPNAVVFKVIKTEEVEYDYWNRNWKWFHPKDRHKIFERHLIQILSGEMLYANRKKPLNYYDGEVWVGAKWIARRIRERDARRRKRLLYGK